MAPTVKTYITVDTQMSLSQNLCSFALFDCNLHASKIKLIDKINKLKKKGKPKKKEQAKHNSRTKWSLLNTNSQYCSFMTFSSLHTKNIGNINKLQIVAVLSTTPQITHIRQA